MTSRGVVAALLQLAATTASVRGLGPTAPSRFSVELDQTATVNWSMAIAHCTIIKYTHSAMNWSLNLSRQF